MANPFPQFGARGFTIMAFNGRLATTLASIWPNRGSGLFLGGCSQGANLERELAYIEGECGLLISFPF